MADPRRFIYSSDYPMPYLVYYQTATYSVGGSEWYNTYSLPHGLPFTPLLVGQWSNDANFAPSYDIAMQIPSFAGGQPSIATIVEADSSQIWFDLTNNTGSDVYYYFRLAAFPPPTYFGEVSSVDDASAYSFNSDFNYLKIAKQGKVTVAPSTYTNITHNLGYTPQSRVWYGFNTYVGGASRAVVSPLNSTRTSSGLLGAMINNEALSLCNNTGAPTADNVDFYYHIYADEN